ncbi:MAG: hypothetical protein ACK4MH_14580 [Brevundimonas sp.]|uniref:hypothetical protein n=1 Tax=Brevundimonas sp. TaxID=1871086 RepID=UPI003919EE82
MTLRRAAAAAVVLLCIAGCDRTAEPADAKQAPDAAAPAVVAETPTPDPVAPSDDAPVAGAPAVDGAPAFAAIYPGGQVEGQPLLAGGEAGAGGLVTFTTDASPDQVVAFYRERAEAAGLRSVTGMNQGEARAYGAAGDQANGPSLQVVAAPTDAGATSVQLGWSAGQ